MITAHAYAKINWSLAICGNLPNGYHSLDMLMQRISLCDTLTFESASTLSLIADGIPLPQDDGNLVLKAARALNQYAGTNHGARITLEKHIPARAGLGGGSADCACALIELNRMWELGLTLSKLETIGLSLGADVPFCVRGCFCKAEGVGEILTPVDAAPEFHLALVTPGGGLSTPQVFRKWNDLKQPMTTIDNLALAEALNRGDFALAAQLSHNDLEVPAVHLMPEIKTIIDHFYTLGARFSKMTGSGSTVFAVFDNEADAKHAAALVPGAITAKTLGKVHDL